MSTEREQDGVVCLTGDVHEDDVRRDDVAAVPESEISLSERLAEIARGYDIELTLFVEGRVCVRRPQRVADLAATPGVEIGGHTYSSFMPRWVHRPFRLMFGTEYGPARYQRHDIDRTLDVLESTTGTQVLSWRTHAYDSNCATRKALNRTSVEVISDRVTPPTDIGPVRNAGLVELPVNTLRDDGYLRVSTRSDDLVNGDWFDDRMYDPDEWLSKVCEQTESIVELGGVATIQAHPIYMYAADGFEVFEGLCQWLADRDIETRCCHTIHDHL
ncbi:polysaccharide deacetylase family protein [Halobium salinum]|uniref:Polysaccharide deacetylase family protein n=1 Tax=Halobium salinum TaxID=1364940 RepID=A0ABD5P9Y8_9EURY|nr:polysaccharide deacetylase family protein [Halobium salinum]